MVVGHIAKRYVRAYYQMEARLLVSGLLCQLLVSKADNLSKLITQCIKSKEKKWDAIAKHVAAINDMEADEADLRKDVDQELWARLSEQVIDDQKYTVGEEFGIKSGSRVQRELCHALDFSDQLWPGFANMSLDNLTFVVANRIEQESIFQIIPDDGSRED